VSNNPVSCTLTCTNTHITHPLLSLYRRPNKGGIDPQTQTL